jgi:hypothetical protein
MGFAKFVFVPNKLKATAITSYIHTRQIIKQTIFLLCMVRTLRSLRPENKVKYYELAVENIFRREREGLEASTQCRST